MGGARIETLRRFHKRLFHHQRGTAVFARFQQRQGSGGGNSFPARMHEAQTDRAQTGRKLPQRVRKFVRGKSQKKTSARAKQAVGGGKKGADPLFGFQRTATQGRRGRTPGTRRAPRRIADRGIEQGGAAMA